MESDPGCGGISFLEDGTAKVGRQAVFSKATTEHSSPESDSLDSHLCSNSHPFSVGSLSCLSSFVPTMERIIASAEDWTGPKYSNYSLCQI